VGGCRVALAGRARDIKTEEICALKRVKMVKESFKEGFPKTAIREMNILVQFHHPNIVNVSEVVVGKRSDEVYMVMEYMEHDLKACMEEKMKQAFSVSEVKQLMLQLLSGVAYLHENWILHRDLKTSNILYNNRGQLKVRRRPGYARVPFWSSMSACRPACMTPTLPQHYFARLYHPSLLWLYFCACE
jgi:serine/threonine protein kinase